MTAPPARHLTATATPDEPSLRPARLRTRDLVRVGGHGLRTRPLRVVLSALGIAIGIGAIVAVVGISSSSQAELDRLLARNRHHRQRATALRRPTRRAGQRTVTVRTPQTERLRDLLTRRGYQVSVTGQAALDVRGATTDEVGQVAAEARITLWGLVDGTASLEAAFLHLTGSASAGRDSRHPQGSPLVSIRDPDSIRGSSSRGNRSGSHRAAGRPRHPAVRSRQVGAIATSTSAAVSANAVG